MQPILRSGGRRRVTPPGVVTFADARFDGTDHWPATMGPDACPDCETSTINVQGLAHCPDCSWTTGR